MFEPATVPSGSTEGALLELEESLREKVKQLEQSELRLRHLAGISRKMAARAARQRLERERQRLGRELHTGIGQLLAAVRIQVELIDQYLPVRPRPVTEALQRISALASDALEQVRGVSRNLYVPEWQRIPLPQAIEAVWRRSGMAQRYKGSLRLSPAPCVPDAKTSSLFYRAAQEGISNIIRHSRATSVALTLEYADGKLELTLEDDGVGFEDARGEKAAGIGLRALRDEAAAAGAELSITAGSPTGTKMRILAPIEC